MTERIRKLAKLYEEVSYQAMKESFEEEWKTKADWSIEERIAVALFVIRLMIVKEDFAAAEKYLTDYFTEDEDFSKYKEIIDKNKAEIAKQYEDSDKSVEEKKGEYPCVYLDYTQPSAFGKSYYCHKKDKFCTVFTISCDGYETWKKGSEIKNKEEKASVESCLKHLNFNGRDWCREKGDWCDYSNRNAKDCPKYRPAMLIHEEKKNNACSVNVKNCKYYNKEYRGWCIYHQDYCRKVINCKHYKRRQC